MKHQRTLALLTAAMLTLTVGCGPTVTTAPDTAVPSSTAPSSTAPASIAPAAPSSLSTVDTQPQCPAPENFLPLRVAALKGPSAIGMLPLMDWNDKNGTPEAKQTTANHYEFTMAGAPDQLVGGVIKGEYDIAVLPTNLAANVYNQTNGKVKLATINTLGVLYLVEVGDSVKTVADLAGKTIYSSGKGSTPEYALDFVLKANNITDAKVEYKSEHSEIAALMAAGQATVALLPQPFVQSVLAQNPGARVALDWTKEWEAAAKDGSSLAMSGIVVQQKLIDERPEALAAFLSEYHGSTNFVTNPENLDAVAEMAVKRGIIPKAEVAKKAIPQCNITYVAGAEMQKLAGGFLRVLFEANPKSVGGKLPDDGFYYIP